MIDDKTLHVDPSCPIFPSHHVWDAKIMLPVAVNVHEAWRIIEQAIMPFGWTLRAISADPDACSPAEYERLSNVQLDDRPFDGFELTTTQEPTNAT